jgi:hypothetical protein
MAQVLDGGHLELVSKGLGTAGRQKEALGRGAGLELNLVGRKLAGEKLVGGPRKVGELGWRKY